MRGYVADLIDCLNEKAPMLNDLQSRMMQTQSKHSQFLIERRRQDVRDQVKEMTDSMSNNFFFLILSSLYKSIPNFRGNQSSPQRKR